MASSQLVSRFLGLSNGGGPVVTDARGTSSGEALVAGAQAVATVLLAGRASLEGERVALLVVPGAAFVEAFFGVLLAGGCAVVLSPLHPTAESDYMCIDAQVTTVLVSAELGAKAPTLPELVQREVDNVRAVGKATATLPTLAPSAPALQLYTSGTTGKPKGAVLTHGNLAHQQTLLGDAWGLTSEDTLLHALPLHHMHGLVIALLSCLGRGAQIDFLPAFNAAAVWEAMARTTVFMGVPTMYTKLFAAFDEGTDAERKQRTSLARGLRLATSGSAALPVGLAERWSALTGEIPLERFGMTELGVALSNPLAGARRAGTVGHSLPTVDTRIVGDDGSEADAGELWVAGPSVFDGYFERPDANASAFVTLEGKRWFRTGDTVTKDETGAFKVLGRTSVDILKSGGYKLSALEIEEVLRRHGAVAEVAVVGVPDETWGERVVACVVPRPGRDLECNEDALRSFAKEHLAPYKIPRTVVCFEDLPRNAMGKVVKPELTRRLRSL